jgi:hypothetical protein
MKTDELFSALVGDYASQPRPKPIGRPADQAIRTALVAF